MDITVTDAQLFARAGSANMWTLITEITHDDGTTDRVGAVFPEDILENYAAEYGFDPTDVDTLLEIALYERHLEPEPEDHPSSLVNAPTLTEARDHHLSRIRALRGTGKLKTRNRKPGETRLGMRSRLLIDSDTQQGTPLALLRRELAPDPERVAVLAEHAGKLREVLRGRRAAEKATPDAELRRRPTATELRERLKPREAPKIGKAAEPGGRHDHSG